MNNNSIIVMICKHGAAADAGHKAGAGNHRRADKVTSRGRVE